MVKMVATSGPTVISQSYENTFLYTKKTNIRWTQTAYAVLRQPHHANMLFSFKSKRKQTKKANLGDPADFSITVGPLVADGLFDDVFMLLWALTVLIVWQSMGQSQASSFHPKYLTLYSEDE